MKTKVAINGAEFYAYHGFYEEERKAGNTFIIDAEVVMANYRTTADNIAETVNYEVLYNIVKQEMGQTQKLIETVVYNIISRFKEEIPHIVGAKVHMEKISPQLGGKVAKSVIEMEY